MHAYSHESNFSIRIELLIQIKVIDKVGNEEFEKVTQE